MRSVVRSPVFAVGVVTAILLGGAEAIAGSEAWRIALTAAIPIGYTALIAALGRRGDAASILAGRPVDERAGRLNEVASTWAFGITALVVVAAVAIGVASRGDWAPYALVAVVMAVSYVGSLAILQVRD